MVWPVLPDIINRINNSRYMILMTSYIPLYSLHCCGAIRTAAQYTGYETKIRLGLMNRI